MSRLIGNYGWETGDPNAPSGTSGEIKTVEVDPHSGVKHVEVEAAAKTTESHRANWTGLGYVNNRDYFLRFYFKKSGNPSTNIQICQFGSLVNGHYGELLLTTAGKIRLRRNGSTIVGSDSAELDNNYHYLELRIRLGTTSTNGQIEARLDGVQFAVDNAANMGTVSAPDQLRIGVIGTTTGTGGKILRWDDVVVNDNQGAENNSWPGATSSPKTVEMKATLSLSNTITAPVSKTAIVRAQQTLTPSLVSKIVRSTPLKAAQTLSATLSASLSRIVPLKAAQNLAVTQIVKFTGGVIAKANLALTPALSAKLIKSATIKAGLQIASSISAKLLRHSFNNIIEYGWETGDPDPPTSETGGIATVGTDPHSGAKHGEVDAADSTLSAHRVNWSISGSNNKDHFLRFYFKKSGNPSTAVTLCLLGSLADGFYGELQLQTDGKLKLRRNGSIDVGLSAELDNNYHYLELRIRLGTTSTNGQIEARLDGDVIAINNGTNLGTTSLIDTLRIGVTNSAGGTGGTTLRFDDVVLSKSTWPGELGASSPPTVTTEESSGVGGAIATLKGKVNPNGLPTVYWFEYGTTIAYGSKSPSVPIEVGDGKKAIALQTSLAALTPNTTYHFRLVAENENGITKGADKTFKTSAGPSGAAVANTFLAEHEGAELLGEYGSSGVFGGSSALSLHEPGYVSAKALKAEVTEPDGYARAIATKAQTGWKIGQEVRWGGAFKLKAGFFAAKQGQVDIFRWDNFEQDEITTERGGLVFQTDDKQLRLVRIKEGEPDKQHTLNLDEAEKIIGPEIQENRWYWVEVRQILWHEDSLALNELWIDGKLVSKSTERNCTRSDLEVSRYRVGISATNGKQTNDIAVYVDRTSSGPMPLLGPLVAPTSSSVAIKRELIPDLLALRIQPPKGEGRRWAEDEPGSEDILSDATLTDEIPGGCASSGGTLARDPRTEFPDIVPFSKAWFYTAGKEKVWEGYFDKAPEVSGEHMSIAPALVGNQKHLEGNKSIKLGFIDRDLGKWGDDSMERRKLLLENNIKLVANVETGLSSRDPAGTAAGIVMDFNDLEQPAETDKYAGESAYHGDGIDIGAIYYDYRQLSAFAEAAEWQSDVALGTDDTFASAQAGKDHNRATAIAQQLIAASAGFKYARCRDMRSPTGTAVTLKDLTAFQNIVVLGLTGLLPQGTWPNIGYTAKQMLGYSVPKFASPLKTDEAFLDDDGYIIPQAWYPDTDMGEVVRDVTKYGLYDWFVYFDHLLQLRKPGTYGRFWKAYVGESDLNELGLDSERLWESIVVQYTEVDGTTRSVGPPGSGADIEDIRLQIIDPDHPAVQAELTRRDVLDFHGIGNPATALSVGIRFLEEANLLSRSGSATLSGYVLDDHSVLRPASHVKSGDFVSFVDASDRGYRKIVKKTYSHVNKGAEIDMDAPPSGLEALLERLQVVLIPLGLA